MKLIKNNIYKKLILKKINITIEFYPFILQSLFQINETLIIFENTILINIKIT